MRPSERSTLVFSNILEIVSWHRIISHWLKNLWDVCIVLLTQGWVQVDGMWQICGMFLCDWRAFSKFDFSFWVYVVFWICKSCLNFEFLRTVKILNFWKPLKFWIFGKPLKFWNIKERWNFEFLRTVKNFEFLKTVKIWFQNRKTLNSEMKLIKIHNNPLSIFITNPCHFLSINNRENTNNNVNFATLSRFSVVSLKYLLLLYAAWMKWT